MDLTLQTLEPAESIIKTRLRGNKRDGNGTSLSGLYSLIRDNKRFDFIGDFPVIAFCFNQLKKYREIKRSDIYYVFRKSKEIKNLSMKEKMRLADYLLSLTIST